MKRQIAIIGLTAALGVAPAGGANASQEKPGQIYLDNNSTYDRLDLFVGDKQVDCSARKGFSCSISLPAKSYEISARHGSDHKTVFGPESVTLKAGRICTWRVPGDPNDGCKP